MVIGNRPEIAASLFAPSYTLASVIANEFTEGQRNLYISALIELGLLLFIVSFVVNAMARLMMWTVTAGAELAMATVRDSRQKLAACDEFRRDRGARPRARRWRARAAA